MSRLRVLHLIDNLGFAGAEQMALDLVTSLDSARYERILCITRDIPIPPARALRLQEFEADGGRVIQLRRSGLRQPGAWRALIALLRARQPHVIHGHMAGSSVWAAVLGRLLGIPAIVAHDHGSPPDPDLRQRMVERALARGSHAVVTVSHAERQRWIEMAGADPSRVHVMPNAVEFPPAAAPADLRGELGLPADAVLVGCVGRLRPEKAQIVLVEAAGLLRVSHPDVRVVLVGPGTERERLERAVVDADLEDRVFLLGLREDVASILPALDIAVLCSDREGVPLSLLEYMHAARPIVATRVGGVPEVVTDGVEGLLIAPRDPAALATAIGRLVEDGAMARSLGERARARAREEFDPMALLSRVEALYAQLLGAPG